MPLASRTAIWPPGDPVTVMPAAVIVTSPVGLVLACTSLGLSQVRTPAANPAARTWRRDGENCGSDLGASLTMTVLTG
ncbi:hypothetical protein GCM10009554_19200 [Kribbella koreensis]|uniref:Uncharacterized protein n=1 Tax=Kribbella koreensis TaxID=57909 RepID=A0ABP4ACK9_9ACTN